jgi:putative inorganic carbon (hco3(-)) transporter
MSHADSLAAPFPHPVPTAVSAAPVVRRVARPDARWDVLVVCLAAYILFAVGRIHQVFPALDVVRPVALTGVLAIAFLLFDRRPDRRLHLITGGTSRWLLALLAWMTLSIPTSLVLSESFGQVIGNFSKTVIIFFVVAAAVRGGRDLERLAGAYLLGAVIYSAVVLVRFDVGVTDWRLGRLYYYDANDFATFAVTAMPLAIYFAHRGRRLAVRLAALLGLGLLCVAFVNSGSRGGFLALMAMGLFILLRYSTIALSRRVVVMVVVLAAVLAVASERYWQQMGSILSDTDYNKTAESGRLQIWKRGVGYMLSRPVFGVGPNNFPVAEGQMSAFAGRQQWGVGVRWNAPHNSFLQVGAENGVPGLVFFIAMLASTLVALRRLARRPPPPGVSHHASPQLIQALTASIIGFVVGAFFLSLAYSELLYMLLAFAVGAQKISRIRRPGPAPAAAAAA